MINAQHSAESPLWYSRGEHISAARLALGGVIDLDPCSDAHGNVVIDAKRYITEAQNGLVATWATPKQAPQTVYMNPPGGRDGVRSVPVLFWERLMAFRASGKLKAAVVAAFSIEQFQTTQRCIAGMPSMLHFPFCVPDGRVKWLPRPGKVASTPTHSSAFVYVPGTEDNTEGFLKAFSSFGVVRL